ncbi:Polygalacturonase protein [Rutstroemia sp. NJR-2017a BVV2]|nr:Polygalacturonase protein [Rutstroemia sp. NJR-2017a BVV2]
MADGSILREETARSIRNLASGTGDATPAIIAAAHKCNNGGTVYFPAGQTYTVATALDLTFLSSVDFAILGTIQFKDDLTYWQAHAFQYKFQTASLFWRFGGSDVNIYGAGTGVIDGLGNTWWKAWASNSSVARPILFGTDGLNGATISGLKMKNPPNWFNLYANSTDILVSDMDLSAVSNDSSVAVKCTGSHGISVGSLGQYQGEVDIAENIYIYNISMTNATDGARIKIWPGVAAGTTGSTAGGGTGYVRNITYDTYQNKNNDPLTQCYSTTAAVCAANPSTVVIEDILFKSFSGITSKKYDPVVCGNIVAKDIHVTVPSGKNATYTCTNMNNTQLGLNCA